jgi:hypothetical protein
MDNMKNDSLFVWQPALTAPKYYPVEAQYARVMVGKDMNISMGETNVGYGLGNGFSTIDFGAGDGGLSIPTGLDVLWLSFAEKKFYRFKQDFSKEIQEKILKYFQRGLYDDKERYSCFVVTLLPGGKIWLSLVGTSLNRTVCDSLQAEEVWMSLKDFKEDYYQAFGTLDSLCTSGLSDYDGATENLNINGIPLGLWDKYAKRYPYDINIRFEDKNTILKSESQRAEEVDAEAVAYFSTGEYYELRLNKGVYDRPALQKLILSWCVGETCYHGEFFFDEEEVLKAFPAVFASDGQIMAGSLNIEISKYNNRFIISLVSGGKHYQLKDTKIHVFCQKGGDNEFDAQVVYNNHRDIHSDDIQFIGE